MPAAPAPAASAASAALLATAAAPAWNTYQETNHNIAYAGAWGKASSSASSGGAVWLTSAKGASATFTFTGTGVEWVGIKAATYGTASVSVDGGSATTVKMTASSTSYQQALFHKEGLANKTHTLKITVTSAKPKLVCVDAFKVQGIAGVPDPAPRPATPSGNGWVAYSETSSYLNYYGPWSKVASSASAGGAVKLATKKGAAFQIRFKGDAIEWDGIKAATYGKAQVTLDTVSQGTVNLTTNSTYHKQALFRKSGLDASKVHTLTVTVASEAPKLVGIDNIMVHGGSALSFAPATTAGNGWNAYEDTSSYISYSGSWNKATSSACIGGAVKLSSKKGSSFQVTFKGSAIEWIGITAKTYGSATVVLDGDTQKAVNLNTSTTQYKQALFHREGLDATKNHVLKVTVTSSAPKLVCVDRILVLGHAILPVAPTYVDVDISEQTLRYYVKGKLVLTSPVVTGRPSMPTVQGTFSVYLKSRNTYLTGPGYHTMVSYWMPFYKGYGLHDAVWQAKFGGTRYKDGYGSHGCVNMPLAKARDLYGMIAVGTKVIVHQ